MSITINHNIGIKASFAAEKNGKTNHDAFLKSLNPEHTDFKVVEGKIIPLEKHDEIMPNDFITRTKIKIKQASKLPEYAVNGLKGDKNSNFFEFLQLGNIPYWVGGPMLVWCFGAGGKGALKITKQKAAGVGLYYIAAIAAKALIDTPVKLLKGIDLNRKYKDIVPMQIEPGENSSGKKVEYHKVYESVDFTRWDLLYREDEKSIENPDSINEEYNNIAKNLGIEKELNDSDSTVKPYIKKVLVAASAWKTALMVPLAGLSAGLANYKGWSDVGKNLGEGLKTVFGPKESMSGMEKIVTRAKGLGNLAKDHLIKPLGKSFAALWKGESVKFIPGGKHLGKFAILGTAASIVLANLNIINISYLKKDKYIDFSSDPNARGISDSFKMLSEKSAFKPGQISENTYVF